jgi:hypothetical protein
MSAAHPLFAEIMGEWVSIMDSLFLNPLWQNPVLMIFSVFGKDLCPIFPILQFSACLASLNAQFSLQVSCTNVGIYIWCDLILPIWFWWLACNMSLMSCTKIPNWQHVTSMTYTRWMKFYFMDEFDHNDEFSIHVD